jgi:carboxypeptidase T
MPASELYPTDGASDDNAYGRLGVPAFTFELGTTFFQSCSSFSSTILPTNLEALRYAARVLERPYQLPSGPDTHTAAATPASVAAGQPVTITATTTDARFRQTNGAEPIQAIVGANVFVDRLPWDPLAVAIPMQAADGVFNANTETLTLSLPTTGLSGGRHTVFIQGVDASGAAGAPTAVFVEVTAELFGDGFE